MKTSIQNIQTLAAMLAENDASKADYVVDAPAVAMNVDSTINVGDVLKGAQATDLGHRQLAEYVQIPAAYYDRLRLEDPALLASNVNRWLPEKRAKDNKPERRMVRTLHGQVRALLSDRYQRIDNLEVAEVALSVLSSLPGLKIVSSAITEQRLYIKAVSTEIVAPDPGVRRVGSLIEAGVMIANSEVGMGAVSIKPFANFLWCTNGMVRDGSGMRASHVGRKVDESIEGLLSDSTRRLEDEVVLRKVRDVIKHAFDGAAFERFIGSLKATTQQHIEGDIPSAIEALGPTLGLNVGERQSVLRHLIDGGDLSRYGLANAVTRTAEDVESYDRATEIEGLGYKLIQLPARDWSSVSNAKPLALAA